MGTVPVATPAVTMTTSSLGPALVAVVTLAVFEATFPRYPLACLVLTQIGAGVLGIATAMQSPEWRRLNLNVTHLFVVLLVGGVTAGFAVWTCVEYNRVAGTDKTAWEIARIAVGVSGGPLVGPIANPAAGEVPAALTASAILMGILAAGVSPFVVARRTVSPVVALCCWAGFLAGTVLWFLGAIVSLAVFLS